MAERKKKKVSTRVKRVVKKEPAVKPTVPFKVLQRRPEPAIVQLGQGALRHFAGNWDGKRVKSVLGDVASRKRSVESALLDVMTDAHEAVEQSVDDTKTQTVAELRLDRQYRNQLIAQRQKPKRSRARKGEIRIQGQVLHPDSGKPVAGVVVEAIDKDLRKHDMLAAVVTDDEGRFEITLNPKDYKESGEKLPEVMLSVGADRKNMFYVADKPLVLKENKQDPVTITLPQSRVKAIDAFVSRRELLVTRRRVKASEMVLQRDMENQIMNATGGAVLSLLANGIRLLEARLKKS